MREGYWINYDSGKVFEVDEHEQWIRVSGNAQKLGVPKSVIAMFKNFTPVRDRDKFLLFVMQHAPVMRARGHGEYVTFEYSTRDRSGPMDAIWIWGKKNAGPYTQMSINNFATKENTSITFQVFEETMDSGGYDAVMRVAKVSRFDIRSSIVAALLDISKELLV